MKDITQKIYETSMDYFDALSDAEDAFDKLIRVNERYKNDYDPVGDLIRYMVEDMKYKKYRKEWKEWIKELTEDF